MPNTPIIRSAKPVDAAVLSDIYNHYVKHTHVTFDEEALPVQGMEEKIVEASADMPFLVLESEGRLVGYALSSRWKSRCAYKHSLETSVYLHPEAHGQGYGYMLYKALVDQLKETGVHVLIGGIALPNEASIRLHEKLGFKQAGVFQQVGYKFERWVDVGYWQLIF